MRVQKLRRLIQYCVGAASILFPAELYVEEIGFSLLACQQQPPRRVIPFHFAIQFTPRILEAVPLVYNDALPRDPGHAASVFLAHQQFIVSQKYVHRRFRTCLHGSNTIMPITCKNFGIFHKTPLREYYFVTKVHTFMPDKIMAHHRGLQCFCNRVCSTLDFWCFFLSYFVLRYYG